MTDIFFSYSNLDRERVRPIRDALVVQGFEVFWDQEVPAGADWDSWIRQHLAKSKCAVVFWSAASAASKNVRHEATVAERQGKLIPVLLEPLTAEQFPMGLYAQQAANFADWSDDFGHAEWRKLIREIEAKLTPTWVRRQIDELQAELVAERTRRESAERRDRAWQGQIAKEVQAQQDLSRERDAALDGAMGLRVTVEELSQARMEAEARAVKLEQRLKEAESQVQRERDKAVETAAALTTAVEELRRERSDGEALTAELARLASEAQTQQRTRKNAAEEIASLMAKVEELGGQLFAAEAQVAGLSRRLRDAEAERDAATTKPAAPDIEFAGPKEPTQGLSAARLLSRVAALLAALGFLGLALIYPVVVSVYRSTPAPRSSSQTSSVPPGPDPAATISSLFTIRRNTEAFSSMDSIDYLFSVRSLEECQQNCAKLPACRVFAYGKSEATCSLYSRADFRSNALYDSGARD